MRQERWWLRRRREVDQWMLEDRYCCEIEPWNTHDKVEKLSQTMDITDKASECRTMRERWA